MARPPSTTLRGAGPAGVAATPRERVDRDRAAVPGRWGSSPGCRCPRWQSGSGCPVTRFIAGSADTGNQGLARLVDRSSRAGSSPVQTPPEVEAAISEMRRNHPRWGARRIEFELGLNGCPGRVPSRITVHRVLIRHGLGFPTSRRRRRQDYQRWQREKPMELWQLDIVGGIRLADGGEAKVVRGWTTIPGSASSPPLCGEPRAAPCVWRC
jgi:hypothetical protein